jgi:hypothetical protein
MACAVIILILNILISIGLFLLTKYNIIK